MNTLPVDDADCPACGSSPRARRAFASGADDIPLNFSRCPHCDGAKCCMCNMGDDVECLNCRPDEDEGDDEN